MKHPGTLLLLLIVGCTSTPTPALVQAPRRACVVGSIAGVQPESISVATTSPISPAHARAPTNAAERFVAAQLYETLIGVDCDGRAYPGLARSWTVDATKTRIMLVLRDGARFWSGDPVVARDVVAAWQSDTSQLAHRIADATTIVDDRTLTVSLPNTDTLILADPSLVVARPRVGAPWPQGTGAYRASESAMDAAPGRLALSPTSGIGPRIMIRSSPDPRDAIDAGADLLVTGDPIALSYAATHSELVSAPLPWNRAYVLLVPHRAVATEVFPTAADSSAFRLSFRDAVRAEARAADSLNWVPIAQNCEPPRIATTPPRTPARRIVYRADDEVARSLGERLVALGRHVAVVPLAPSDYAVALRGGGDLGYVVPLSRSSLSPCLDLAALASSAPWLGSGVTDAIIPLVATRDRAVMKRDRVSASVDWDGTLRIARP